jgi:hypothetical protein
MEYIFQYPLDRLKPRLGKRCPRMASEIRRWAVELTGRNSVRPSTMPKTTDNK